MERISGRGRLGTENYVIRLPVKADTVEVYLQQRASRYGLAYKEPSKGVWKFYPQWRPGEMYWERPVLSGEVHVVAGTCYFEGAITRGRTLMSRLWLWVLVIGELMSLVIWITHGHRLLPSHVSSGLVVVIVPLGVACLSLLGRQAVRIRTNSLARELTQFVMSLENNTDKY